MALNCKQEVNGDNLIDTCLLDGDEVIIIRTVDEVKTVFRTTYGKIKSCLIPPPMITFTVDGANVDIPDVITFPLGGGTTFFSSALVGRRSAIVMVNNAPLPQRAVQPDYCTPDFTAGTIERPDGFKSEDNIEIYIL